LSKLAGLLEGGSPRTLALIKVLSEVHWKAGVFRRDDRPSKPSVLDSDLSIFKMGNVYQEVWA